MTLIKHASRFHLALHLQNGYTVVELGDGTVGVYLKSRTWTNDFGTPLALRGSRAEVETFLADMRR